MASTTFYVKNLGQRKAVGLLVLLLVCSGPALGWPWSWNKVDKNDLRHGKWRTFHDEDQQKTVYYKGHYKHGKENGRWKIYAPDGRLYYKEKFKRTQGLVKTTYYHSTGKKSHEGMARQFESTKGIWNYYWDGTWHFYDSAGVYLGDQTFVQGKALSAAPLLPEKDKKWWQGLR